MAQTQAQKTTQPREQETEVTETEISESDQEARQRMLDAAKSFEDEIDDLLDETADQTAEAKSDMLVALLAACGC